MVDVPESVHPFLLLFEVILVLLVVLLESFLLHLHFLQLAQELPVFLLGFLQGFLHIPLIAARIFQLTQLASKLSNFCFIVFLTTPKVLDFTFVDYVLSQALLELIFVILDRQVFVLQDQMLGD